MFLFRFLSRRPASQLFSLYLQWIYQYSFNCLSPWLLLFLRVLIGMHFFKLISIKVSSLEEWFLYSMACFCMPGENLWAQVPVLGERIMVSLWVKCLFKSLVFSRLSSNSIRSPWFASPDMDPLPHKLGHGQSGLPYSQGCHNQSRASV